MAIEELAAVPLGLLFLLSGLIVNAACYVTIRPFSKSMYRMVNIKVVELLWYQIVWLFDWWAGMHVELFADFETLQSMGKEHALIMSNHQSDIDWLVGWVFAQRSGCLGSSLAIMKNSSKFLPVVGWSMWFTEFLFIERSWDKMKKSLQQLKDFPQPFWLALFAEGTRFTHTKLLAAQKYAALQGLPIPRNGFVSTVNNIRSFVPAIYDVIVAVPKTSSSPTMLRILKGESSVVHVHIKRHSMEELPQTDEGLALWCKDLFVAKDALLDRYLAEGTFGTKAPIPIGRPIISLLVVMSWSCLLTSAAFRLFEWSTLLSTWNGILCSSFCVLLVAVIMHIFVLFSQSDRSTAATVASTRVKDD
ncbi:unnamed protein product [Spirodela intermedia]|uniref:1-acylglycerol-3-phosphate O-acyltransferase n=1 Tax=Spirodela intermedia TaxID=51605 RepID=A0A7I8JE59_SPIIN|nr:unnamed protein product [Spirodela intermedia]CAA6668301.1 unnamed protein product [Spirodela intermedia]